jgi:hypothetical protein
MVYLGHGDPDSPDVNKPYTMNWSTGRNDSSQTMMNTFSKHPSLKLTLAKNGINDLQIWAVMEIVII